MTRPSKENPDYVKYSNDKKQKKETLRHLEQRLVNLAERVEMDKRWLKRAQDELHRSMMEHHELFLKIQALKADKNG